MQNAKHKETSELQRINSYKRKHTKRPGYKLPVHDRGGPAQDRETKLETGEHIAEGFEGHQGEE